MNREKAEELIKKYVSGECTPEERRLVEAYFNRYLESTDHLPDSGRIVIDQRKMLEAIHQHIGYHSAKTEVKGLWLRIAAAGIVFFILSLGFYFYSVKNPPQSGKIEHMADILPGDNRAVLTLADGRKISLMDTKNGMLAVQSGIKITKTAGGQLVYTISDESKSTKGLSYNSIETPIGGQYQVNLPDGSKVWLNSASSIRYPVRFSGNERRVQVTGEAYFEIAHNKEIPFKVNTADQVVEVLGTHFNIMAYQNEKNIKTTLLEGAVKISSGSAFKILSPGQQSQLESGRIEVVDHVDIEDIVAWKNGYFKFNENLESVMNKIARWYNVEVVYQFKPDLNLSFGGEISRSKNLSVVLNIIELTGNVHFKVEGRRVTVMQ